MAGLKCRLISRKLWGYLEEEMPARVRENIERHLAHCRLCRDLLSDLKEQRKVASLLRPVTAPEDFTARVMSALSGEAQQAARPARLKSRPLSLAQAGWTAAVFAMLALVIGYFAGLPPRPGPGSRVQSPGSRVRIQEPRVQTPVESASVQGSELRVKSPEMQALPNKIASSKHSLQNKVKPPSTGTQPVVQPTPTPALTAEEWLQTAQEYEENGQLEEALSAYESAAAESKDKESVFLSIGRVYEKLGLSVPALEAFAEVLSEPNGES